MFLCLLDLLPVYSNKEGENNIILEGRLAVFIVRDLAENLKYENFEDILLLLENLISLVDFSLLRVTF